MGTLTLKPLCIGLTGGIASGKTTACNFFSELGVPIIDADIISHEITQKNTDAYHQIVKHFGTDILNQDKTLNRKALRDFIFQHPAQKQWLEKLLHPLIRAQMKKNISAVNYPYCICAIPLLAESRGINFIDRVLVIDAPTATQISRIEKRDQSPKATIEKIISAQASAEKRLAIADDILKNEGNLDELKNKVAQLHNQYLALSAPPIQHN